MAPSVHTRPAARLLGLRKLVFGYVVLIATIAGWFVASLCVLLQPRSGRLAARVGRLWGRAILTAAGGHLVVRHAERLAPGEMRMVVANHASYLDPPAMLAVLPLETRILMKRELGRLPFLGWYVKLAGHYLVDRERARSGRAVQSKAVERARRCSHTLLVFPEGTRSMDGRLQAMRAGSFQMAVEAGMPVQPVAIQGTAEILPKRALGPKRRNDVVVTIGEPISTEGLAGSRGRKVIAARVREALLDLGVPDGAETT
jgi:1-acyl-sn-glycerol-3-phosphate acyltransferase